MHIYTKILIFSKRCIQNLKIIILVRGKVALSEVLFNIEKDDVTTGHKFSSVGFGLVWFPVQANFPVNISVVFSVQQYGLYLICVYLSCLI